MADISLMGKPVFMGVQWFREGGSRIELTAPGQNQLNDKDVERIIKDV
jgi:hypothetical protein